MAYARSRRGGGNVRVLFRVGTTAGLSDAQLLERFARREGEVAELAFAALVDRHGGLVWRTCRAILRDEHDAQDAFQASFLVLATKAHGLRVEETVGPWLHQVACRVAASARAANARRRRHERLASEARATEEVPASSQGDLDQLLHEEIGRLPDSYRAPLVMCCLQGMTREQAAAQLGWPQGTVQSRLARAKRRLRDRLSGRGIELPGAMLAGRSLMPSAKLATDTTTAALSFSRTGLVATETVSAAVKALTQGVLWTMFWGKTKSVALIATLAGSLAIGAASMGRVSNEGDDDGDKPVAQAKPAASVTKFEVRSWKDGKPAGKPVFVKVTPERSVTLESGEYIITIESKEGREMTAARRAVQEAQRQIIERRKLAAEEQAKAERARLDAEKNVERVREDEARVKEVLREAVLEEGLDVFKAMRKGRDELSAPVEPVDEVAVDRLSRSGDLARSLDVVRLSDLPIALDLGLALSDLDAQDSTRRPPTGDDVGVLKHLLEDAYSSQKSDAERLEATKVLVKFLTTVGKDISVQDDGTARLKKLTDSFQRAREEFAASKKVLTAPVETQINNEASALKAVKEQLAKKALSRREGPDQEARLRIVEDKLDQIIKLLNERQVKNKAVQELERDLRR